MYRLDLADVEKSFTKHGSLALAAAAIETVLDDGNDFDDLHRHIRAMLDDFWRFMAAPMVEGHTEPMTERAWHALPSWRLYDYTCRLLELCSELARKRADHPKAADLADGVYPTLLFIVWQLESIEFLLNPGKPRSVPCDVAETNWSALTDGLELLAEAARDPDRAFAWQKDTIARIAHDHPYALRAIGTPVPPAYFGLPDPPPLPPPPLPALETPRRLCLDEVEYRFALYALIALAIGTIEQLLPVATPDFAQIMSSLVEDLWAWQATPQMQGRSRMSEAEAATLPSYHFYRRMIALPTQPATLAGIVRGALLFIAWVMDAVERELNPVKPFVLTGGDELEDEYDALLDLLAQAVDASPDPAAMLAWERQAVLGLRTRYPSSPDTLQLTLGEPVTRDAFQDAIADPETAIMLPRLEAKHRLRRDEIEDRFTEYALIALVTATIEHLLPVAPPELASIMTALVADLWSWQADPKPEGRSGMSEAEAATLPASRFHARLAALPTQPAPLASVVRDALLFITWIMDAAERRLNRGRPYLFTEDSEPEDDFGLLLDILEQAVDASRDPAAMLAWERQAVLGLCTRYPADQDTPALTLGAPVTREAFQSAVMDPETAILLPKLDIKHRLRRDEVERQFTQYALIALATATIERLLPASDFAPTLSALVTDLWAWQAGPKPEGRSGLSEAEAATFPSSQFYARLTELPVQPERLASALREALRFSICVMDIIETQMNPGKPYLFEDEEIEDVIDMLLNVLKQAVDASPDPAAMLAWERQAVLGLRTRYPADRDTPDLTFGEPVTREAFENAIRQSS